MYSPIHQPVAGLAACPFCGHTRIYTPTKSYSGKPIPSCGGCGAEACNADAWNRRTLDPTIARTLEAAERLARACEHANECQRSAELWGAMEMRNDALAAYRALVPITPDAPADAAKEEGTG